MAVCRVCGNKDLEWVKDNNKWKLYNFKTGVWHSVDCTPTPAQLVEAREQKKRAETCRHGILTASWCDLCNQD